jgi:SAM-dependent methyltransferase
MLCKSTEFQLVTDKIRYDAPRKIYRCAHCGLVFLYPQMSPEEERIFYEQEYGEIYSNEKGTTPAQLFKARLNDAALYYEWTKQYFDTTSDCLELGCASGYFLSTIKKHVKSVTGIETHILLKNYCRELGINMVESLSECSDNQFDVVFMFFLLEHIGDPKKYLQEIKRVLKNGGRIVIVVPNVDDALFKLYDIPGFRIFYFTPAHQFYYSKDTLSDLLKKAGFSQFMINPIQRYDLSNHMHWLQNGKPGGVGKFNHIFSHALEAEYAKSLKEHFLCDTLLSVVTKQDLS